VNSCGTGSGCLLLLVWQAPLGVRSAKRRHPSPEWTIRLIQGDVVVVVINSNSKDRQMHLYCTECAISCEYYCL